MLIIPNWRFLSVWQRYIDNQERSGTWTIRLPVDQFPIFLKWLDEKYHVMEKSVRSRDVTEEFVDLQSRLSNKRKTETRLSEYLSKSTAKLSEILEMEKEMDRVREDIERIEGKLQLLSEQSELSTLVIRADSKTTFVAAKSPSTLNQLVGIFTDSWRFIGACFYGFLAVVVALTPFAIVLSIIAWLVFYLTGLTPLSIMERCRSKWRLNQK